MRRILVAVGFLCLLALGGTAISQQREQEAPTHPPKGQPEAGQSSDVWMRTKLKYGQNIYTSIAQADIAAISLDAKRLKALNWFESIAHGKDAAYQEQLRVFQLANDNLIAAAEKKNLDGCTLAFMQMTFSCTACHQRLRDASAGKKLSP